MKIKVLLPTNLLNNENNFWGKDRHPSYDPKSTLQSFGKKSLQMGNGLRKCKVLLKDAERSFDFVCF